MKRTVWLWELFGFAVTALGGTLLHFVYEWSGKAVWLAPFSGVNESTWEHMKLLFWPAFIYTVFESFFFREYKSFWCVKLYGMLIGLGSIPVLFYTYNGVIGKSPDWINIAIFFVSAALAYVYTWLKLSLGSVKCRSEKLAIVTLCAIGVFFILFTFKTPDIGIFLDPLTGSYGIR